jgi:8-oxo-dGTP pyrophosphatase MutT (NUDIX family)
VVVRGREVAVIVPARRKRHVTSMGGPSSVGGEVLALPKGHLDGEETPLEAAIREVREETGVEVDPIEELGQIRYSYQRKAGRVDKRVVFFLLRYRSGELAGDHEIADVRWMELEEAARLLTYSGEREMVSRALSRVAADL